MTDEDEDLVMSLGDWNTNGDLIADIARLGYLTKEGATLDVTYGEGTFWTVFRPDVLVGTDIDPEKSDKLVGPVDFTDQPWDDASFDNVVFDPDYKLNGRPDPKIDKRYGVHVRTNRVTRLGKIEAGVHECARVLGSGFLIVKCMDQVEGGKMRWQTDLVTRAAEDAGLVKVDVFIFRSYRPQPHGTTQKHARHNFSTALIFKRVKKARRQQSLTV